MNMSPTRSAFATVLLLVALTGCSTYDTRYAFEPRPAEAPLRTPEGVTVAQMLTSVVGVRRAVPAEGVGAAVEVRVRIDNVSDRPMRFDPGSLTLLSADLRDFPRPHVDPAGIVDVTRETPVDLVAFFPIPDDSSQPPMDLSGLSLRWAVVVEGTTLPGSLTFERRRYSSPPHWNYGWHFGYYGHRHSHFGFSARCH